MGGATLDDPVTQGLPGKVRLVDVARVAGVSLATASRVLNHPDIVRPDVRQKVRSAITTLSFMPDAAARALASGKSRAIGAVVPTLGIAIFANGIEALQDHLGKAGFALLLANSQYDRVKELHEIKALLERGVDGMVLVGDDFSDEAFRLIRQYDVPVVTTYVCKTRHGIPAIGVDNVKGAYEMTKYLISLGHRNFGIITSTALFNDRIAARQEGIQQALALKTIVLKASQIVQVSYSVASGRVALRTLMAAHPNTTAVICTTDALALGALAESRALGLLVPKQLSITGYDDVEVSCATEPPLTTVHVPAAEIGRLAAGHLINAISGKHVGAPAELRTRLVLRGSCAKPSIKSPSA